MNILITKKDIKSTIETVLLIIGIVNNQAKNSTKLKLKIV